MTNPSETDMNLNATDTTAKAILRLKNANNGYTMTFSAHAADGAEAMGYVVTSEKDFDGDTVYYIYSKK